MNVACLFGEARVEGMMCLRLDMCVVESYSKI